MTVIAVDPGHVQTGWVAFDGTRVLAHAIQPNATVLTMLGRLNAPGAPIDPVAGVVFEQIESFGMPVGREIFETVFWTGRFYQGTNARVARLTRRQVKLHLCQSAQARDSSIRVALLDRFGGAAAKGTKTRPGPLFGIKADEWSALAIAVTWCDLTTRKGGR